MSKQKVNASLPTVNIKGNPYVTVDSRVEAFWELYPTGSIITEVMTFDAGLCMVKASVLIDGEVKSTGHAFENQSASNINKTSFLENCETSAVGRALGFLGIGLNGSIASADEVATAIEQQEAKPKPKDRFSAYKAAIKEATDAGISMDALKSWQEANVGADTRTFTDEQIAQCTDHFLKLAADKKSLGGQDAIQ